MSTAENMWGFEPGMNEVETTGSKPQAPIAAQQDIEIQALNRIINGKVMVREDRRLFIHPSKIWCNLDDIEIETTSTFVPIEGDWVSLAAKVTVDEDITDLTGEIIKIKSIKPLQNKSHTGRVTLWNMIRKGEGEGAIEREIYFNQEFCERGYIPSVGDEVIYDAIESEQGEHDWRAISVIPLDVPKTGPGDANGVAELDKLLRDKNGIGVIGHNDFGEIRVNETKETILEVKNFGKATQTLLCCRFHSKRQNSQITLISPGLDDRFQIKPGESVKFKFECKGKFVGFNSELFVFTFKGFRIGRNLEINIPGKKFVKSRNSLNWGLLYRGLTVISSGIRNVSRSFKSCFQGKQRGK